MLVVVVLKQERPFDSPRWGGKPTRKCDGYRRAVQNGPFVPVMRGKRVQTFVAAAVELASYRQNCRRIVDEKV